MRRFVSHYLSAPMELFTLLRIVLVMLNVSPDPVMSIVSKISMVCEHPFSNITVTWTPSQDRDVFKYIVLLEDINTKDCVMFLSLHCSNCTDKNNETSGGSDIGKGCSIKSPSGSFLSTENPISVTSVTSSLQPYTLYNVSVISVYDYNNSSTDFISARTGQSKSDQVLNMILTSQFPQYPLNVGWTPPTNPKGVISQYVIYAQSVKCIFWTSIDCSDCPNMIPGERESRNLSAECALKKIGPYSFLRKDSRLSIHLNYSEVKPFTKYAVTVVPVNEYGWGNNATLENVTGQFVSKPVRSIAILSQFPELRLNITWSAPDIPNGEITQYIVYVKEKVSARCVMWTSLNGGFDTANSPGDRGSKDLTSLCKAKKNFSQTFEIGQSRFNATISDTEIEPYTLYSVYIVPVNAYGWGDEDHADILTGQYKSDAVRNLSLSSQFPNESIVVNWSVPLNLRGQIVKYAVIVHANSSNTTCISWWSIACHNCSNNTSGDNVDNEFVKGCGLERRAAVFPVDAIYFTTTVNHEQILPYAQYIVTVFPINGYSWGEKAQSVLRTSQYKSSGVNNFMVNGTFPRNNLVATWRIPSHPRGQIVYYYVFVYKATDNMCVKRVELACVNCENNTRESRESQTIQCTSISIGRTYSTHDASVAFNDTDQIIQPDTSYKVCVYAVNGYGWGMETCETFRTQSYRPLGVTSLQSLVNWTTVDISWGPPIDDIFNFTFRMNVTRGRNTEVIPANNTIQNRYTFNDNLFCTFYGICVWTSTPFGDGEVSCITNYTGLSLVSITSISLQVIKNMINISWNNTTPNNCSLSFHVSYNQDSVTTNNTGYSLNNLRFFKTYDITVTPISNFQGNTKVGIKKHDQAQTDVGIPTSVRNFECAKETFNQFKCTWKEPSELNGPNVTYLFQCMNDSQIDTPFLYASFSRGVVPDVKYTCKIGAKTSAGGGEYSETTIQIEASEVPYVSNDTEIANVMMSNSKRPSISEIHVTLPYSHFTETFGRIIRYSLVLVVNNKGSITNASTKSTEKSYTECDKGNKCPYEIYLEQRSKRSLPASVRTNEDYTIGSGTDCGSDSTHNCNGPLSSNTEYLIAFRAYTRNGFLSVGYIKLYTSYDFLGVAVAVPIVLLILIGLIIATLLIYRRRRKYATRDSLKSSSSGTFINKTFSRVDSFGDYYKFMMKDSYARVGEQFLEIHQRSKELECEKKLIYAVVDEMKNRYKNIKPYEHNMVRLSEPDCYINASKLCSKHPAFNIVEECRCNDCYIATQGPLGNETENKFSTIGDFWRMALQQNVAIIVNLTKCLENFKEKCTQYWPDVQHQEEVYKSSNHNIGVTLQRMTTNEIFEERVFSVTMEGQERCITQLHFTSWSDHGCPEINDFLEFYTRYSSLRTENTSVIVHCSAGVGRTGTFILIDMEVRKIWSQCDRIEIYDTLVNLRQGRCLMVQTEKQYVFVHDVIYEYLKRNVGRMDEVKLRQQKAVTRNNSYLNPAFE